MPRKSQYNPYVDGITYGRFDDDQSSNQRIDLKEPRLEQEIHLEESYDEGTDLLFSGATAEPGSNKDEEAEANDDDDGKICEASDSSYCGGPCVQESDGEEDWESDASGEDPDNDDTRSDNSDAIADEDTAPDIDNDEDDAEDDDGGEDGFEKDDPEEDRREYIEERKAEVADLKTRLDTILLDYDKRQRSRKKGRCEIKLLEKTREQMEASEEIADLTVLGVLRKQITTCRHLDVQKRFPSAAGELYMKIVLNIHAKHLMITWPRQPTGSDSDSDDENEDEEADDYGEGDEEPKQASNDIAPEKDQTMAATSDSREEKTAEWIVYTTCREIAQIHDQQLPDLIRLTRTKDTPKQKSSHKTSNKGLELAYTILMDDLALFPYHATLGAASEEHDLMAMDDKGDEVLVQVIKRRFHAKHKWNYSQDFKRLAARYLAMEACGISRWFEKSLKELWKLHNIQRSLAKDAIYQYEYLLSDTLKR